MILSIKISTTLLKIFVAHIFQILLWALIFLRNVITAVGVSTNYLRLLSRILRLQKLLILQREQMYLSMLLFVYLQ